MSMAQYSSASELHINSDIKPTFAAEIYESGQRGEVSAEKCDAWVKRKCRRTHTCIAPFAVDCASLCGGGSRGKGLGHCSYDELQMMLKRMPCKERCTGS
jgi:hypothetical protein